MISLTALILTFNEKENIARTLAALTWVERIVIVDSFSTDGTPELAKGLRPELSLAQRRFDSHAEQWNFGLDGIHTEWVLTLDADYEVTPELAKEIAKLDPPAAIAGFEVAFRFEIFGHALRSSVYPPRVALFRTGQARYFDDGHTQRITVEGAVSRLNGLIIHDDRKPLGRWLVSQDKYAALEAKQLLAESSADLTRPDRLRKRVYFAPAAMFFHLGIIKRLLFDGWPGWFYICQRVIAELLLSLQILVQKHRLEEHLDDPSTSPGP